MCWRRWLECRPPMQHPGGYKTYHDFIRWKRLEAPKPYFDEDGYYCAPWLWLATRRVIPRLMPMPEPIQINEQALRDLMDGYKRQFGINVDAFKEMLDGN